MLDYSVSFLPFVVVALANFFLSWFYYSPASPTFKTWQLGVGMDPNKKGMTEQDKKEMPRLMGGALIATLLFAYGLQVFVHSLNATTFAQGAAIGFMAWLVFAVTHSLNTQFEGRKPSVLIVNNIWYIISYCIFGGILAVWR